MFFITQIHRVHFVSVHGEASRVKSSKKKFWKKVENKILKKKLWGKNLKKKILGKKIWSKILKKNIRKKFWIINFGKLWNKNFEMKVLTKKITKQKSRKHLSTSIKYNRFRKKYNIPKCVAGKEWNFLGRVWCEQYEPKKSTLSHKT